MPIYDYRCEKCGYTLELQRKVEHRDRAITIACEDGKEQMCDLKRALSAPARFKGLPTKPFHPVGPRGRK